MAVDAKKILKYGSYVVRVPGGLINESIFWVGGKVPAVWNKIPPTVRARLDNMNSRTRVAIDSLVTVGLAAGIDTWTGGSVRNAIGSGAGAVGGFYANNRLLAAGITTAGAAAIAWAADRKWHYIPDKIRKIAYVAAPGVVAGLLIASAILPHPFGFRTAYVPPPPAAPAPAPSPSPSPSPAPTPPPTPAPKPTATPTLTPAPAPKPTIPAPAPTPPPTITVPDLEALANSTGYAVLEDGVRAVYNNPTSQSLLLAYLGISDGKNLEAAMDRTPDFKVFVLGKDPKMYVLAETRGTVSDSANRNYVVVMTESGKGITDLFKQNSSVLGPYVMKDVSSFKSSLEAAIQNYEKLKAQGKR